MSTNLDKSLDEILAGRKGGRGGRRGAAGSVGGVKKRPQRAAAAKATAAVTQTQSKAAAKAIPTGPSSKGDASKIIVSNLPLDVKEVMIKEYFSKAIGHVKSCSLSYGPNGISRGIATIVFSRNGDAEKAAATYNGVLVDKRPMKVELVVEPKRPGLEARVGAPNPVAPTSKPAAKPKPATNAALKGATRGQGARAGRRGGPAGRGGRPGRAKPKTAEELDAEMAEYWDGSAPAPTVGGATTSQYASTTVQADAMDEDGIMVGTP
ncbi:hypothetical protein BGX38DRAFT_1271213 [Terfezia claveryi]|nr:hypothetical protein BGX38DRAFT_1271213 [Terfezia claveryi]